MNTTDYRHSHYTIDSASELLGFSNDKFVRLMIKKGMLKPNNPDMYRLDGYYYFDYQDIIDLKDKAPVLFHEAEFKEKNYRTINKIATDLDVSRKTVEDSIAATGVEPYLIEKENSSRQYLSPEQVKAIQPEIDHRKRRKQSYTTAGNLALLQSIKHKNMLYRIIKLDKTRKKVTLKRGLEEVEVTFEEFDSSNSKAASLYSLRPSEKVSSSALYVSLVFDINDIDYQEIGNLIDWSYKSIARNRIVVRITEGHQIEFKIASGSTIELPENSSEFAKESLITTIRRASSNVSVESIGLSRIRVNSTDKRMVLIHSAGDETKIKAIMEKYNLDNSTFLHWIVEQIPID